MPNALNEKDIQSIIKSIGEEINLEKAKKVIAARDDQTASPYDLLLMSANKITDKNGVEKFIFVVDSIGTLIMGQDDNGLYQVERMEGQHQDALCIFFHTAVKLYAQKIWGEDLIKT
ncbi:hypothetical protein [Chryseobacterium gambrini]|uniref:hypothetical protein n=1 Tax=Chryseobacterium gambrini TaxID=373672 RepID=UPI003D113728